MNPASFTQRTEVIDLIGAMRRDCTGRPYSDIVDEQDHQYVDVVMAGGGLLGIAIVGYLYALEAVGIRFLRIGGTSAGSITALLLAALGTMEQARAEELVKILSEMDTWSFVDGGSAARSLVGHYLDRANRLEIAFDVVRVLPTVWEREGLNPGRQFLAWLSGVLAAHGITTTAQLRDRMGRVPAGLRKRAGEAISAEEAGAYLALVTADIVTETKVDFPRMARLYWADSDRIDPALYVRASMSIPFFFEPMIVEGVPRGEAARALWSELAGFDGDPPGRCAFIDGGIMSNFPIEVFHQPDVVPTAPTFGIALGGRHRTPNAFDTPWRLAGAIFDSARHCLDYDFIARNPDYKKLVGYIDTEGFDWLDFKMSDEQEVELFAAGVRAVAGFLRAFDWQEYKEIRSHLAKAQRAGANRPPPAAVDLATRTAQP